jgi:hypothetical protein
VLKKLAFRRRLARVAARRSQGMISTPSHPALLQQQLLFEHAPFQACHAATISADHSRLNAAWFGGSSEGNADVDIWGAHDLGSGWSTPQRISKDPQPAWNPVLFRPADGPLQRPTWVAVAEYAE